MSVRQQRGAKPRAFANQALGRLKAGTMNKTERAYSDWLRRRLMTGEVAWYRYEGIKVRLADNTFYTPDFAVMLASGEMQLHEVKGARSIFHDDARAKVKITAEMYPFAVIVAYPRDRECLGWEFEIF